MTILDEIEAKLAAAASSHFGMALPADAVEVGQRLRVEQDALANEEDLPLEDRLQAAFRALNRTARPWRYLQLFVSGWLPFRDPAVAARVLVEQWSDFDAIPVELFVDLVFPHLSPETLMGAMNAEARKFLDHLPDPFLACRGQDEGMPSGLSWATDPATAECFARGHRGMENPRPAAYQARIVKGDVAFVCIDGRERAIILRRPPVELSTAPARFDARIVMRKRGRPSKAELERDRAYAEYLQRIKTCSPPPGGWPLVQPEPSARVPKKRDVGRPYDVDPRAPFELQFGKKLVERFISNAAWLLRFEKDRYRSKAGDRKYVLAHDTDKLLEKIIAQLLPEVLRLESEFRKEAEQRFLDPRFPDKRFLDKRFLQRIRDQVETLQRMVGDENDQLYGRDDRRNLKQRIMIRERNLDQKILDRKRVTNGRKRLKSHREPVL